MDIEDISDIITHIANILIRKLSDETTKALRIKAAENGRFMTEEARSLIEAGIQKPHTKKQPKSNNWVQSLLIDLGAIGDAELEMLQRDEARPPRDFSGAEFEPRKTE